MPEVKQIPNKPESDAKSRLEAEKATLQLTEAELEQQCDELFSEPPIPFDARKGNVLENRI